MKAAVQASQRLKPELAGLSSHAVAKTKSQLLTETTTILNAFRSVELASTGIRPCAPASVAGSGTGPVHRGTRA
jgi:hypothetical protein